MYRINEVPNKDDAGHQSTVPVPANGQATSNKQFFVRPANGQATSNQQFFVRPANGQTHLSNQQFFVLRPLPPQTSRPRQPLVLRTPRFIKPATQLATAQRLVIKPSNQPNNARIILKPQVVLRPNSQPSRLTFTGTGGSDGDVPSEENLHRLIEESIDDPHAQEESEDSNEDEEGKQKNETPSVVTKRFWKKRVNLEGFPDVQNTTELFLNFLSDPATWNALRCSKMRNRQVFQNIVAQMQSVGLLTKEDLGDATAMIENKWKNLRKAYRKYVEACETSGNSGDIEEPPFYEQLSKLLDDKHDIKPVKTRDSLIHQVNEVSEGCSSNNKRQAPDNSGTTETIHDNVKKSSKPSPKKKKIDNLLQQIQQSNIDSNTNFNRLFGMMETTKNEQLEIQRSMSSSFDRLVQHIVGQPPPAPSNSSSNIN